MLNINKISDTTDPGVLILLWNKTEYIFELKKNNYQSYFKSTQKKH